MDQYKIKFIFVLDRYTMLQYFFPWWICKAFIQPTQHFSSDAENLLLGNSPCDLGWKCGHWAEKDFTQGWKHSGWLTFNTHCPSFSLSFKIHQHHLSLLGPVSWHLPMQAVSVPSWGCGLLEPRLCLLLLHLPSTCCTSWHMGTPIPVCRVTNMTCFDLCTRVYLLFFSDDKDDMDYSCLSCWYGKQNMLCEILTLRSISCLSSK